MYVGCRSAKMFQSCSTGISWTDQGILETHYQRSTLQQVTRANSGVQCGSSLFLRPGSLFSRDSASSPILLSRGLAVQLYPVLPYVSLNPRSRRHNQPSCPSTSWPTQSPFFLSMAPGMSRPTWNESSPKRMRQGLPPNVLSYRAAMCRNSQIRTAAVWNARPPRRRAGRAWRPTPVPSRTNCGSFSKRRRRCSLLR